MADSFYFQHDYDAGFDSKIMKLRAKFGAEGYGAYWLMIEQLARSDGYADEDVLGMVSGTPNGGAIARLCIELGLFIETDRGIESKRMNEHLMYRAKLSKAGKKGALKRHGNTEDSSPPNSHPSIHPSAKERKGKERKENNNTLTDARTSSRYDRISSITFREIEAIAMAQGVDLKQVEEVWEDLKIHCQATGEFFVDYYYTLTKWVRYRKKDKQQKNKRGKVVTIDAIR